MSDETGYPIVESWPLEALDTSLNKAISCLVETVQFGPTTGLELSVELPGNIIAAADDIHEEAVQLFRQELEKAGWLLACNRFRYDAIVGSFAYGLSCYLTRGKETVGTEDAVDSFGPTHPQAACRISEVQSPSDSAKTFQYPEVCLRPRPEPKPGSDQLFEAQRAANSHFLGAVSDVEPAVGDIYQLQFLGGRCVFVTVLRADKEVVVLRVFQFMTDTPDVVPSLLFESSNLMGTQHTLGVDDWGVGYFKPTEYQIESQTSTPRGELISILDFGLAVADQLNVIPWL